MLRRRTGGWLAASASALLWVAVAGLEPVRAAGIGWEGSSAFQACLEAKAKVWIDASAALVLNEDPAASAIDDRAVAKWTNEALDACGPQAGRDRASEQLFGRYMARWREHIDAAAEVVRRKLRPD